MNKNLINAGGDSATTVPLNRGKRFPHLLGETDKQANTSMYYGFTPVKAPEVSKDDLARARHFSGKGTPQLAAGRPTWLPEEKVAVLRMYAENEMGALPQPVMLYYRKPLPGTGHRKSPKDVSFGLDVIGTSKPVGEGLVIAAAVAALRDDGVDSLVVELNSVGDKDAMAKHERELGLYLRKHANAIPAKWRAEFRSNPFALLSCCDPEMQGFRDSAPKSVSYLGEAGRRHFMEVIEYLETLDIPYRINHTLVGNRGFASHVIFDVKAVDGESETTVATGSRYGLITRKLGFKKEVPAVGASILYRKTDAPDAWKQITNPKFYFVQFGNDARMKSLRLIEALRRERIAIYHSLTKDKLMSQMASAENLKVPYILLMGIKEALENTVVVRNLATRAQETVDMKDLAHYLRRLK